MKILIADDDPTLVALLSEFLRQKGHQVWVAYSGDEGIDLCMATRPDVAVVDIFMPGKDGLEMIRHVKEFLAETKIIAISGVLEYGPQYMKAAHALGADGLFTKPLSLQSLDEKITELRAA